MVVGVLVGLGAVHFDLRLDHQILGVGLFHWSSLLWVGVTG
jgi:hypothetical protein